MGPLLLLGLYVLASYFNLKVADRMMDWTVSLLTLQWLGGYLLNIVAGLALCVMGLWLALYFGNALHLLPGICLAAFGMWRVFRGVILLRQWARDKNQT